MEKAYYVNLAIGPGIKFYQALCSLSHTIYKYELRIPDTYHVEMEVLLSLDEKKGFLVKAEAMSMAEFKQMLISEAMGYVAAHREEQKKLEEPAYIIRKRKSLYSYTILGVIIRELYAM